MFSGYSRKIPSYKKFNHIELLNMDDFSFQLLRKNLKQRNRLYLGKNKALKIDRLLKNKRTPYGSPHISRPRAELVRCMKQFHPSEILDTFNSNRNSKNWLSGNNRKKVINRDIYISNFSFIDAPNQTLEYFYKLAEYEPYALKASISFADDQVLDIAPYLLFGLIQRDMYPFILNGRIKSGITNIIERLNLDKFMGITIEKHQYNPNIYALPLSYKPTRENLASTNVSTLEVEVTRLIQKIDEWLSKLNPPMVLTDDGKSYVQIFSSEILDNAQRHSIIGKEGNWAMAGFMEYREEKYHCCLSFLNTGLPIYKTIIKTENSTVAEGLKQYINQHKEVDKDILATVFALQDGSTRENYLGSKGGVGMMKMIKFINEIGETDEDLKPVISILTGNVCIRFTDKYRNIDNDSRSRNIQWFNEKETPDLPPDKNYAFLLKKYFPGTIITTRFILDEKTLRKKFKNDNE